MSGHENHDPSKERTESSIDKHLSAGKKPFEKPNLLRRRENTNKSKFLGFLAIAVLFVVFAWMKTYNTRQLQDSAADKKKQPSRVEATLTSEKYLDADFRILFIGNSHTVAQGMPGIVEQMLNERQDEQTVFCTSRMGSFLAAHAKSKDTTELIQNGEWDVVVLQAQKYSTSGRFSYPTDAAMQLTEMAQQIGAQVLMFPEWARYGYTEEAQRVHDLHESIAAQSGAKVVPIGLAWEQALQDHPDWVLHDRDGNHANAQGAFLTAALFDHYILNELMVLSKSTGGQSVEPNASFQLEASMQVALRNAAHDFLNDWQSEKSRQQATGQTQSPSSSEQ